MNPLYARVALCLTPLVTLGLSGCQAAGPQSQQQQPPVQMIGSNWKLVSLGGDLPVENSEITLAFGADGQASGAAGVNRYFGPYQLRSPDRPDGALAFGEFGTTRIAGPDELMTQEQRYLGALRAVTGYRAGGALLELDADGRPLLRFRQIAPVTPTSP